MITLLTGVPGVGKSTVAAGICASDPGASVLNFGRVLFHLARSRGASGLTYETFRQRSWEFVDSALIEAATSEAHDRISAANRLEHVLVDSHAVSTEAYGFRSTPDTPRLLELFSYDLIVQLHAAPEVILERHEASNNTGRLYRTVSDVATATALQFATSTYYAGITGCTLHVVDASPGVEQVVATVLSLLSARQERSR